MGMKIFIALGAESIYEDFHTDSEMPDMPTKEYLFRHRLAMEIAGIDPLIFNKIVADGFYECAPEAVIGKARPFTENDLLGLIILKHLMDMGMTPRHAGPIACDA